MLSLGCFQFGPETATNPLGSIPTLPDSTPLFFGYADIKYTEAFNRSPVVDV